MSLLHSPGVLICATLTKLFADQFAMLNDEERLVVIDAFCLSIGSVLNFDLTAKGAPDSNSKSHEEN